MSKQNENLRLTARVGYDAHWSWSYLLPKYWGVWCGIFLLGILAFVPFRWRDKLAEKLGVIIGRKAKRQRHRANVNLRYCFPYLSDSEREKIIDKMFVMVTQVMLGIGEIALRSK